MEGKRKWETKGEGPKRERKHGKERGKEFHRMGIERLKGKEVEIFEIIRCNSKETYVCDKR